MTVKVLTLKGLFQIYKKEIKTYFISPIAYVVISLFLLVSAFFFFFWGTFFLRNQASMRMFFSLLPVFSCFVVPAITMSLFSEEINLGSYELLLTMPVTFLDIIFAKFLAALTLTAICYLPTVSYAVFISFMGNLDWGPVAGGYFGGLLMGAGFCAVGLMASSLTRKQIIAYLIGWAICFALWLLDRIVVYVPLPQFMLGFLQFLGADYHFQNIAKGIIDTRDILYFVSLCFFSLYGTKLIMEEQK
ncbi:MAG: ABC transporter permease subunit [Spirochaetales bacterium]|nr:ABC transporter permease subunit [Spirochaetales bacterium]